MKLHNSQKTFIDIASVELYCRGIYRPTYFIRHIFFFLHHNPSLLDNTDYRHLYDETLDFQVRQIQNKYPSKKTEEEIITTIKLLADLYKDYTEQCCVKFDKQTVDQYLLHRKSIWETT